jgi:uncharacterized Rmd1/YagE family protein
MDFDLFKQHEQLNVHALFLGQRLDLRAFEQGQRLGESPLVVTAGAGGCAVLFRYGVAVLYGVNAIEEAAFIKDVQGFVIEPFAQPESEETVLVPNPDREGIISGHLHLHEFSIERLQLVADVLAKSVVLAHYEKNVAGSFDRIEPLAADLRRSGRAGRKAHDLISHIGQTLSIQSKMVGRVEVEEKPELLWEMPDLERLFLRLEDEYELVERHKALERKLELIARTAETLLGLMTNKRTLHVEWYIVILIVIEVVLMLYEIFVQS